jgi:hypothetical protein
MRKNTESQMTGMNSTDTCSQCGKAMSWNINRTYVYCPDHPGVIVYNDKAWNQWIKEQNEKEWESLRRLESGD